MAGIKVAYAFIAENLFSGPAERIARSARDIQAAVDLARESVGKTAEAFKEVGESVQKVGRSVSVVGAAIGAFGALALKKSADMEQLTESFEIFVGDAQLARAVLGDLVQLSGEMEFPLTEVIEAGKRLLAFGVPAREVEDRLRRLADIGSVAGIELFEMARIYGRALADGKISMLEVIKLSERGISIQQMLAAKFHVSEEQVTEAIQAGAVSFEVFNDLFEEMTDKGGKFFGMAKKNAGDLDGQWSRLRGSFDQFLAAIGDAILLNTDLQKHIESLIVTVGELTAWVRRFTQEHPTITRIVIAFAGFLIVLGPILIAVGALISLFGTLSIVVSAAAIALGVTSGAVVAMMFAIPIAIAAVIAAGVALYVYWDDLWSFMKLKVLELLSIIPGANWLSEVIAGWTGGTSIDVKLDEHRKVREFQSWQSEGGLQAQASIAKLGDVLQMAQMPTLHGPLLDGYLDISVRGPKGAVDSIKYYEKGAGPLRLDVGVGMAD